MCSLHLFSVGLKEFTVWGGDSYLNGNIVFTFRVIKSFPSSQLCVSEKI